MGRLNSRKPVAFVVSYLENPQGGFVSRILGNKMVSVRGRLQLVKDTNYVDLGLYPPLK